MATLQSNLKASINRLFHRFMPDADRQKAELIGKQYKRTGECHTCGKCCTNIYLLHGNMVIKDAESFKELQRENPEYLYFTPVYDSGEGLQFTCKHLQPNNRCGIYLDRPSFCKKYPSEEVLMNQGELAPECGYSFEPIRRFQDVLQAEALSERDKLNLKTGFFSGLMRLINPQKAQQTPEENTAFLTKKRLKNG